MSESRVDSCLGSCGRATMRVRLRLSGDYLLVRGEVDDGLFLSPSFDFAFPVMCFVGKDESDIVHCSMQACSI